MNGVVAAPAVSVILPTYQRRGPVIEAVRSVQEQLFRDFELIVIDDGSTDGTAEALAPQPESLRLIRQPNRGAASARNAGLRAARGEFVAFLDSDNRWLPEHLAFVVQALDRYPEAVLAYTLHSYGSMRVLMATPRLVDPLPRLLLGNFIGSLSTVVARRDAVTRVGGFDERLNVAEDADLWLRLALGGDKFAFVARRTLVEGRSHDSLMSSRTRGEYALSLEASTARALERLKGLPGAPDPELLEGRLSFARALRSLAERDNRAAQEQVAAACRLLPDLHSRPQWVVNHVRFALPGDAGTIATARQLARVARLWPDRNTDVPHALRARALATVLRPPRPQWVEPASRAAQNTMLRTERGPLRPVWRATHELLARAVATYVRGGDPTLSAYLRGSLGGGDPVYGLSDIDLALVVAGADGPDQAGRKVDRRWRRLRKRLPAPCAGLIERPEVYGERQLNAWSESTTLTHGLAPRPHPSWREQQRVHKGAERSLLRGLTADWRLLRGPERRVQRSRPPGTDDRRLSAWLELQYWWLQAFRACAEPTTAPWVPFTCVKLMTEPARIWLWLRSGERIVSRRTLIERARHELPEEEVALRSALELLDSLGRGPKAPLAEALAACLRMSQRISTEVQAGAGAAGSTAVRLCGDRGEDLLVSPGSLKSVRRVVGVEAATLPLADWRALVWPPELEECFSWLPAAEPDPALIGAMAATCNSGAYASLRFHDLAVLPSLTRARLRAVQCPCTDPVSFALMDSRTEAMFPDLPGWSARDSARRAVSEHMGWLRSGSHEKYTSDRLGRQFNAARAALFHDSLEAGDPQLAIGTAAVARRLADTLPGAGSIVREAQDAYRAQRLSGESPPASLVEAFGKVVADMPVYV